MNVGFATGRQLDRSANDEHKFSLFGNAVKTTLNKPEIRLMQHERVAAATAATVAPVRTGPPSEQQHPLSKRKKQQQQRRDSDESSDVSLMLLASSGESGGARQSTAAVMEPIDVRQSAPRIVAATPLSPAVAAAPPSRGRIEFAKMSPAMQREIIEDVYGGRIRELKQYQPCLFCGESYRDWDNVGRHKCRWHPGRLTEDVVNPVTGSLSYGWSCCGAPYRDPNMVTGRNFADGCCLCDHTVSAYQKQAQNITHLPLVLIHQMQVPMSSVAVGRNKSTSLDSIRQLSDVKNLDCGVLRATYKSCHVPIKLGFDSFSQQQRQPPPASLSSQRSRQTCSTMGYDASVIQQRMRKRQIPEDMLPSHFVFRSELDDTPRISLDDQRAAFQVIMN